MQFSKLKQYKVVELKHALVIIDPDDDVKDKEAQPLMIGNFSQVMLYLDRYLWEREQGTDMRTAHERGLRHAGITVVTPTAKGKLNG